MMQIDKLADTMFAAAATVLGRLVEQSAVTGASIRADHEGSIHTDGEELVALSEIPALGAQLVVRFQRDDLAHIVGVMLGGEESVGELGPMQLSIASETVSQIAVAMAERLAENIGASTAGIHAELCTDASLLPPPPFQSYSASVQLENDLAPRIAVDFAAITLSKLGSSEEPAPVAATAPYGSTKPAPAPVAAAPAQFAPIVPTQSKKTPAGQANLDLVHDVPLQVRAILGKTVMQLRDVVSLQQGSVFELDKLAVDPIDIYVNNILIARGEVVVVDDKYAVKISELNPQVG
ncbi:MAG: flagellar motor switch protein FliN [Candidatus Eremiobacteraeota bacterium]|nr:flagellar motor switch protein FliN [Candidatus Eremiobacteraeota bacterium]NNM93662.1 flagellar motor switch protein FliN [Candidatus Eremiobacteraeota bacterium]